jgi:hypothetical protein
MALDTACLTADFLAAFLSRLAEAATTSPSLEALWHVLWAGPPEELDAEAHSAVVAMLEDLQTLRAVTDDVAAEMRVATRLLARGGGRSPGDHAFDREASALRGPGVSWSYVRARKQLLWTAGRFLVGAKPWTNCYFCCQVGIE